MEGEGDAQGFKCNNCRALFSSIDKVKEHYRGDWHILNSKRRAQGLVPLTKDEFKQVKTQLPAKKAPLPTPPKPAAAVESNPVLPPRVAPTTLQVASPNHQQKPQAVQAQLPPAPVDVDVEETGSDEEDEDEEEEEPEVAFKDLPVDPLISLFDNSKFATIEDCMEHMNKTYGFFIPDFEYMVDLSGMLEYLGAKIKKGGVCLYCQRTFRSAYACQSHMKDSGHCKLAYDEDIDMDEYEDYYDYFEDDDEDSNSDSDDDEDGETAHISSIGELVLPDGRIMGHRAFRIYYKQHHRVPDTRPSVLAQEREEILRIGNMYGSSRVTSEDLIKMNEFEIRSLVMRYHKEERKGNIVEQRGRLKRLKYDQKREYRSIVDKSRSSATTTAKIRDYHKTVM